MNFRLSISLANRCEYSISQKIWKLYLLTILRLKFVETFPLSFPSSSVYLAVSSGLESEREKN